MFRMRNKGVKSVRGGAQGDLLCRIIVETPVKLNSRQKELLEEFQQTLVDGGKSHSPKAHGWLDGVKKFFDDMKQNI